MADVATLGLQVESASVRKGTDDLNKLSGAAARAEAATDGLAGANRGAAGAAAATAQAYAKEGASAASASKQLEMFNRAANQNARGPVGRGNVANLAAQFQDVADSAQMGMGALQIGLQQGTQLAAVIATMENPVRGLAQAFTSVLSPASLLTIALVSLVAVGIQMIDWPKLAASALHALADVLEDIASYAIGAAAALALLYAPAIIGGIITVIALLGRLAVAAVTAAAAIIAANPIAPSSGSNKVLRQTTIDGVEVVQFLRPGSGLVPKFADIVIDSRWPAVQLLAEGYFAVGTGALTQVINVSNASGMFLMVKYMTVHGAGATQHGSFSSAVRMPYVKTLVRTGSQAGDSTFARIIGTQVTFFTFRGNPGDVYLDANASGHPEVTEAVQVPVTGIRYYIFGIPA